MSCPNCVTGGFLPGEPTGIVGTQGAYFAAAPPLDADSPKHPSHAILLLTDGFGLALKNCKIMADEMAKRVGCDVWVPDIFAGKPLVGVDQFKLIPDRAGVKMTTMTWIKFIFSALPSIPAFIQSRPTVVDRRLVSFIKALQDEKHYEKFGAVGYCYGGSTAVRLGGTGLVQCVVICHPGNFSISEVNAIKVPASWACAEDDLFFSPNLRMKSEAIFAARKDTDKFIDYEFEDYKGTAHGFAARPNLDLPEVKAGYEGALEQAVAWFAKHFN
ncbi:dienelactone hydrolase endo-1,3,1,4-beta-D-glucanase [Infundibulicybe gibba]|nr:dienelactone hydrolase endo-1,3,1,4-beta-D-glucanase [Infundibulicybe gibba]